MFGKIVLLKFKRYSSDLTNQNKISQSKQLFINVTTALLDIDNVAMNGKSVLGQVLMGLAKVNPLRVAMAVSSV